MITQEKVEDALGRLNETRDRLMAEIRKGITGQEEVIEQLIVSMLARGHCLLTGIPGLGKTLLVKTLSRCLTLEFKRIQFTPDLMPADVLGSEVVDEDPASGRKSFRFAAGPIFSNVVLADEINRTPPKTQAALLEAMEEGQVTVAGQTRRLDSPFFVLATQNPIELEGTYPLPEAQLDRFLLNPIIRYLSMEDEIRMVGETTGTARPEPDAVLSGEDLLVFQELTRQLPAPETVIAYAVALSSASRPQSESCDEWTRKRVRWGAGSRGAQALILASKAKALLAGRPNVSREDVKAMAPSALRHRILPSFFADSEGLDSDDVIAHLIESVNP